MSAVEPFFCARAAEEREEPIAGTAPRGAHWVLVEHRGGWPVNGFEGLDLDPRVRAAVFAAAQSVRARILLIRRHGRRDRHGRARWAVLHQGEHGRLQQHWGAWEEDSDLLEIVRVIEDPEGFAHDDAHAGSREPSGASPASRETSEAARAAVGEAGSSPVVLVCAHGQHDVCCAVRGRPVAQRLSELWPELVWECTHVGGDRFAANVLIVPDGVYYGRLDADAAVRVVADHLGDRIRAEHLRGYTDLAPVEQVAVVAALETSGPAGRRDHRVVSKTWEDGRWVVRVAGRQPHQGVLDVVVEVSKAPPRRLTCRGSSPASAMVYAVREVRPVAW